MSTSEHNLSPFTLMCTTLAAMGLTATILLGSGKSGKKVKAARKGRKEAKAGDRKFIVGGNWKCATDTTKVSEITHMLNKMPSLSSPSSIEIFVAPPNPFIAAVAHALRSDLALSSQDCGKMEKYGAFTGDMYSGMLKDIGCEWAIVGHSERRQYQGESSAIVAAKAKAALAGGLGAVICIGESKEEREKGMSTIKKVLLDDQMMAVVSELGKDPAVWANVVIAYEPVWAIGTGLSATPEMAQETHLVIREWVKETVGSDIAAALRIQYGGSVKGSTAFELAKQPDIDGFLVGSASLKPDFLAILEAAAKASN